MCSGWLSDGCWTKQNIRTAKIVQQSGRTVHLTHSARIQWQIGRCKCAAIIAVLTVFGIDASCRWHIVGTWPTHEKPSHSSFIHHRNYPSTIHIPLDTFVASLSVLPLIKSVFSKKNGVCAPPQSCEHHRLAWKIKEIRKQKKNKKSDMKWNNPKQFEILFMQNSLDLASHWGCSHVTNYYYAPANNRIATDFRIVIFHASRQCIAYKNHGTILEPIEVLDNKQSSIYWWIEMKKTTKATNNDNNHASRRRQRYWLCI